MSLITPHGGKLVNREAQGAERENLLRASATLPSVTINARAEADLELIAIGALSPLEGFLGEADYLSVRDNLKLANGQVWSIPITLSATAEERAKLSVGEDVALKTRAGQVVAVLHLSEIYTYDKQAEAQAVYGTAEDKHPGVQVLYSQGEFLLGGKVTVLNHPNGAEFKQYRHTPAQTRALFEEKNWTRIVAF
ncbi:MAG: sulfate adenylyltransferase, partial [Blastocatellia bacterium]